MTEAHVDVRITGGYLHHLFHVGFSKKCKTQIRKTSSAQHQQVGQIHKEREIMTPKMQTNGSKEVVIKLTPDHIGKDIEKTC